MENCEFKQDGPEFWVCIKCQIRIQISAKPARKGKCTGIPIVPDPPAYQLSPFPPLTNPIPSFGPGTELKEILKLLGINPGATCTCNKHAMQMDEWGVEGCRKNIDEIVGWLRNGDWTIIDLMGAATRSITSGLQWEINPFNPFKSLVEISIKRAIETENKKAAELTDGPKT